MHARHAELGPENGQMKIRNYINMLLIKFLRVKTIWGSEGRWFKSSRPDQIIEALGIQRPSAFLLRALIGSVCQTQHLYSIKGV
jgi:hypothetical protein